MRPLAPHPNSNGPLKMKDFGIATGAFDVSPVNEKRGWIWSGECAQCQGHSSMRLTIVRERSVLLRNLGGGSAGTVGDGGGEYINSVVEVCL